MKPQHPKFAHMQNKEQKTPPKEVPVHTVMSPEDEAQFMQEMNQLAQDLPPVEEMINQSPIDDALVQKELERKAALEKLVLFKQPKVKTVTIGDVEFRLKLLNVHENALVYAKIRELSAEEQLTKSPVMLLAASLVDANGIKIEDNYSGPEDITDSLMQKYYELSSWNMPIINALVTVYTEFVNSVESEYKKGFLDKSPKTPTTD